MKHATLKKINALSISLIIGFNSLAFSSVASIFTTADLPQKELLKRNSSSAALQKALQQFTAAAVAENQNIHSIMVVQHGNVVAEQWMGEGAPDKPHILNSVSKTFTATAIGFAVSDGLLSLDDSVISFFPNDLPDTLSENLKAMTVRDLLTMSSGHDTDPTSLVRKTDNLNWAKEFLSAPIMHKPGTYFCYNSLGTYMLSAIIQQKTGMKLVDYLNEKLFIPLNIEKPQWDESPQGINTGGWGLYLKTEDLAKMGQFLLQKGTWEDQQLLPASWIEEATTAKIDCYPAGMRPENVKLTKEDSDWVQGYGYQMWLCRHNGVRADGAKGQFIILLPEQDAVVVLTADLLDMQDEINLVWKYILPAL